MTKKRVGGITFVRMGRLQLSYCICRPTPHTKVVPDNATLSAINGLAGCVLAFLVGFAAVYLPLAH